MLIANPAAPKVRTDPYSKGYWTPERIGELPLTNHAADGPHNPGAALIQSWMATKYCKPLMVYVCQKVQQVKFVCPSFASREQQNGLIVGLANPDDPAIVTGYDTRSSYWSGSAQRDGCIGPFYVP